MRRKVDFVSDQNGYRITSDGNCPLINVFVMNSVYTVLEFLLHFKYSILTRTNQERVFNEYNYIYIYIRVYNFTVAYTRRKVTVTVRLLAIFKLHFSNTILRTRRRVKRK